MKILAIDFGTKKIGLAIGDTVSRLAEPYDVIRLKSIDRLLKKVEQVVKVEQIVEVILGISEGRMAKESKQFGKKLEKKLNMTVKYQDETLSTKEAQMRAIEAGIKREKRRKLEDAYSATLILQSYFNSI